MTKNGTKDEMLATLQQEQAEWQRLLADLDEARMTEPFAGGWSIKDILAHLIGWRRWTIIRLQAVLQQEPNPVPPWPPELEDDDEINAWIYAAYRDRSLAEVLHEDRAVFQQLADTLSAFPEGALLDRGYFDQDFDHFHDDHEPDMRAWLARTRP